MAHLSGFTGSITFTGPASTTVFAPATTSLQLQSWNITQETDTHQAIAKSEQWKSTFHGISRWRGTATFLMQDGGASTDYEIREAAASKTLTANFNFNATTEYLTGTAHITRMDASDPLDGPTIMTVDFVGNGALTATATGA